MSPKTPYMRQQRADHINIPTQHNLILAIDIRNRHLLNRRDVLPAIRLHARIIVSDEVVNSSHKRPQMVRLRDEGNHAVLAAELLGSATGALGHDLRASAHKIQRVLKRDVPPRDEGSELAERVPQRDVAPRGGVESELRLEDAQDHDGGCHDGGLGVDGCREGAVGAFFDEGGELVAEEVVDFFDGWAGAA
ncbi:hypothetical protein V502_10376, partial [Pseudogymnoascus sp. VKM F-4520 (FW-2644)]